MEMLSSDTVSLALVFPVVHVAREDLAAFPEPAAGHEDFLPQYTP